MRRRPRLTTRGVIALIVSPLSALAGVLVGAQELVLLAIAVATFVLVGFLQCRARLRDAAGWHLSVQLSATDIPRDTPAGLSVTLQAAGRAGSVPVRLEDPSARWELIVEGARPSRPNAPALSQAVLLPPLDSTGSVRLQFPIPTDRRGIFRMDGLHLWCFDALSLFAGLVAQGPGATVTILPVPVFVPIDDVVLAGEPGSEEFEQPVTTSPRQRHDLGDFAGLRTYVPGDRLRLLYWPALARTGELLVRDFEDAGPRRLHLLADVRPHLGSRGAEAVLAAAAGAGLRALAAGTLVEFATTGGYRVAVGPGPHGDLAFLRALAAVVLEPVADPGRSGRTDDVASRGPASMQSVPDFTRRPLVVTTSGGANSLTGALRGGHVVIAS